MTSRAPVAPKSSSGGRRRCGLTPNADPYLYAQQKHGKTYSSVTTRRLMSRRRFSVRSKRERSGCKPSITPFTTMLCTVYAASGLAFSLLTRLAGVLVTAVALRLLLFTDALDLNALFSRELVIAVNFDDVRLFICDRKNTVLYNCHSECRRLNRLHALSLDVSNVDNWDDSGSPARCRVVVCYLAYFVHFCDVLSVAGCTHHASTEVTVVAVVA